MKSKSQYLKPWMIKSNGNAQLIRPKDILYLTAKGNYTVYRLIGGTQFSVPRTLAEFEKRLPKDLFLRIHRSAIINTDYFVKYDHSGRCAVMKNAEKITVSRRMKTKLIEHLDTVYS
ncbi:MAG: LytTR family transcriptional regulator [Bacteroidia bacterium]|nr:LytTR family transcriptional regulator [Bacteroidia bacterium]